MVCTNSVLSPKDSGAKSSSCQIPRSTPVCLATGAAVEVDAGLSRPCCLCQLNEFLLGWQASWVCTHEDKHWLGTADKPPKPGCIRIILGNIR